MLYKFGSTEHSSRRFQETIKMAFKILSIFLLVCLVGSIHSASFERVKREDGEETTAVPATETTDSGTTAQPSSTSTSTKSPLDFGAIFGNFGQIFPSNNGNGQNWYEGASSFLTNVPNWFGPQRS
ncbi:uncharacterized protein LOC124637918 [Helicoverpa zea]|uniref:uncharacterized protein LOC124637918 n=1 Tax=Helicoverpa zea TaxID=7113 RepID=UPI001F59C1AE|nr:uncharacterized protein LOC124637918 [Helicoverpa zea]